jgi:hypothetical protein
MKNKIFAFIIVIAGIILAVLWNIEQGHKKERARLDGQYKKSVNAIEKRLDLLALKAKFLEAEMGWVQLERWVARMKGFATDKHGQAIGLPVRR